MSDDLHRRIESLETRVAHQDATIEDLNATIIAQWRKIDALVRDVLALRDRLQELSRRDTREPELPPPHY